MSQYVVFDCYQTLIYKKSLDEMVRDFSLHVLEKRIPLRYIKQGYNIIYDRYKFRHPHFETLEERENFYIGYNKEFFGIIGISISSYQALQLYKHLEKAVWACYPDTLTAIKELKTREISLGLLANWTETLHRVLEDVKLASYFDAVHSSHDLKIEKPNPKIFTKALKNAMKEYDIVYYIGDDYELDIIPAREVGLMPILIDRDNRYPDSVDCERIRKLTDLVERL